MEEKKRKAGTTNRQKKRRENAAILKLLFSTKVVGGLLERKLFNVKLFYCFYFQAQLVGGYEVVRTLRLIIIRIRFRASDFGVVVKINFSCKIETGFLCGDDARVILFFARVIQELCFWTQKIQANVDYCYVRRRTERTLPDPGLEHPSLRSDSSLASKRRAEALHVVFVSTKHPSPARELLLCVYSRMIRSHERRALGALLSLFSRSEPASTNS